MKTPRIANAIGQIDDDLVAGAAKCKTKNKKHWLKWGSLAACFAVLVIAGAAILPSLFRENVTPEGTDGRYKDFSILSPGNGRATFAASENRLGPDLVGLLPGTRPQGINRNVSLPPR